MGWTMVYRPQGQALREFFADFFGYDAPARKGELVDLAVVHRRVAYAAYRVTEKVTNDARVGALVMLLSYPNGRKYENFGFKDMSEADNPNECACPLRIYEQLTPLPEVPSVGVDPFSGARHWRARVEGFHVARAQLVSGVRVVFDEPLRLSNGDVQHELMVLRTLTGTIRLMDRARPDLLYRHRSLETLIAEGRARVVP